MENKKSMNLWVAVLVCLALAAALVFISLNKTESMNNDTIAEDKSEAVAKEGLSAQTGDTVALMYTGRLVDGTVFDSNVDPKFGHTDPLEFTLGAGQMIPGFEKEVLGMKVGEKKTLNIPPEEAYGEMGRPPVIPPNATLIFDVELLAIN